MSKVLDRITSSAIRELLTITERPEIISLAGGLPAPDAFPAAELAAAFATVIGDDPAALQYSATEGNRGLREWAAARHGAGVDEVLVTNGSQQGLELVARATLDPGDVLALADPGYVGAIQAFGLAGAHLHGVPCDEDGLDVEALEHDITAGGLRPRAVYVVPSFHNPAGGTLTHERASRLAELAERYGFLIVEDDPYSALRWRGTPPPPLRDLAPEHTVALRTFSKVLAPGLRIGFAIAPKELASSLGLLKQATDLHTSTVVQRAAHAVVTTPGFLDGHLARITPVYEERASALVDALHRRLGDRLRCSEPDGGMFLWCATDVDTTALLPTAIEHGVAFVPGRAFAVGTDHTQRLRLSFATAAPDELDEAVSRLASAFDHR
ncbi:MAG TPA: PLP-dependent aminotransferase family protein [Acidimicrobiales bacterium]|nr:PLP-dependent aminotransferase family protein [Acidimicrobiales bacterium]